MTDQVHLRFAPQILARLGEELVPHPDQGVLELVRNSYDANALKCTVELLNARNLGGTVRVTDDGDGMTEHDIVHGWLVLGRSPKTRARTRLNRLPVGDKGLGRLAALRMGTRAVLRTRPRTEPGVQYRLTFDWRDFEAAESVADVNLDVIPEETDLEPGTTVEILNLQVALSTYDTRRLARSLLLLSSPFPSQTAFSPELIAPEWRELEERVREGYREEAELRLEAKLDSAGLASAVVYDWKSSLRYRADHHDIARRRASYQTPPAEFQLWLYVLDKKSFSARASTLTVDEVKAWLREVGGVHLYHRGLRVAPYGDPGHDWLNMNLRRAQTPEERPSTNNSLGRVLVDDPEELLTQKTDRSGFVENEAYQELRQFAMDVLEWLGRTRSKEREQERQAERRRTEEAFTAARASMQKALPELSEPVKKRVEQITKRFETAANRRVDSLRSELELYRTMSTVGTTTAVFAHETSKPALRVKKLAEQVRRKAERLLGSRYHSTLEAPIEGVLRNAAVLLTFAELPLQLLRQDKRRAGPVDVNKVIDDLVATLRPFADDTSVKLVTEIAPGRPYVSGTVASLESILANLIVNAVQAFTTTTGGPAERRVEIRSEVADSTVLLTVLDNGPGIKQLTVDEVWLPGQTTTPGGTGIGLTIVRDASRDLGGAVHARANGELGGAEFTVQLPLMSEGRSEIRS